MPRFQIFYIAKSKRENEFVVGKNMTHARIKFLSDWNVGEIKPIIEKIKPIRN